MSLLSDVQLRSAQQTLQGYATELDRLIERAERGDTSAVSDARDLSRRIRTLATDPTSAVRSATQSRTERHYGAQNGAQRVAQGQGDAVERLASALRDIVSGR